MGGLRLLWVGVLLLLHPVVAESPDEGRCAGTVKSWSKTRLLTLSSVPPESTVDGFKLRDLLFFLHVPRTGGRTLNQCFLKHIFGYDQRCPRSYDKLRIDRSRPGCRLISTHDDYSLLDKLPRDMTSVVTSLRNPVDRVSSDYEFSIEVAARSLRKTRKKSGELYTKSAPSLPKGSTSMSTLDIWPWKYLVPTMQDDLAARRSKRLGLDDSARLDVGKAVSEVLINNSYDAASLTMPLREFIHHPIAYELVHNGATFQVAGLTNTSYLAEAGEIRTCVMEFPHLGRYVLEVAKKTLDSMLYVGLTDRQKDSAMFFAKILGRQFSMVNLLRSLLGQNARSLPGGSTTIPSVVRNVTNFDNLKEEDLIKEVMESYQNCVAVLRMGQENRRSLSLDLIAPIKFSRESRESIPHDVIDEMTRLNSLDVELFSHAQTIFAKQQNILEHWDPGLELGSESRVNVYKEEVRDTDDYEYLWEALQESFTILVLTLASTFVLTGVLIYLVRKRRGSRVKET